MSVKSPFAVVHRIPASHIIASAQIPNNVVALHFL
jgi:hypothetical protein